MADWRETNHRSRQIDLLRNGLVNPFDVTFLVGPNAEEVKGHQFQLSIHSKVFQQMFKNRKEPNPPKPMIFRVGEGSKQEFEQFLEFVYTGQNSELAHAANVLKYAIAFKVRDLEQWCWKTLGQMTEQTAVTAYELAGEYENEPLRGKARTFILKNAATILDSNDVLKLSYGNLCILLAADSLAAKNETQVFNAVIRWAKEMCKRRGLESTGPTLRDVLQDLVEWIRYPVMDVSDFSKLVVPLQLLSPEDHVAIFKYMIDDESERKKSAPLPFITKQREWAKKVDEPPSPRLQKDYSGTNAVHAVTTDTPSVKRTRLN